MGLYGCCRSQDKANLERQLKQLNSKSTLLEKNLEKKDAQVSSCLYALLCGLTGAWHACAGGPANLLLLATCSTVCLTRPSMLCMCLAACLPDVPGQAEKRRETLLVSMNKTKDALSVTEERYKSLQLDMQRTQMDLLAKTSECNMARDAAGGEVPPKPASKHAHTHTHTHSKPHRGPWHILTLCVGTLHHHHHCCCCCAPRRVLLA